MPLQRIVAIAGILLGLIGLGIDYQIIMTSPGITVGGTPVERGAVGQFIYFWSFFTHLTNFGLVLVYVASLTDWKALAWVRHPVGRASMAGNIALVMVFFHFFLAPNFTFTGGLLVANYILHYAAPLLYLIWWFTLIPHGTLRFSQIPIMLLPGLIYVVLVLVRGAIVSEYPYAILDASTAGYGGVLIGVLAILVSVAVFCTILIAFDQRLGRKTA